jgi:hypothetical protein
MQRIGGWFREKASKMIGDDSKAQAYAFNTAKYYSDNTKPNEMQPLLMSLLLALASAFSLLSALCLIHLESLTERILV